MYMIGSALIQVIKVNDLRKGIGRESGRPYEMQDAECLLLDANGNPAMVGVLQLPKELTGDKAPVPGVYTGAFGLVSTLKDRRIEARLTSLTPVNKQPPARASA